MENSTGKIYDASEIEFIAHVLRCGKSFVLHYDNAPAYTSLILPFPTLHVKILPFPTLRDKMKMRLKR